MSNFQNPVDGVWTVESLIESEKSNANLEWLHFWGQAEPDGGEIGPHVFSQWWPHSFEVGGIEFLTAEHYMMAEKARLFGDRQTLDAILAAKSARKAKELGRKVSSFDQVVWEAARLEIVVAGSIAKFSSSKKLKDYLSATQTRVLVEASPTDTIWGIGLAHDHPDARTPSKWLGPNLLGLSLMKARAALAS